MNGRERILAAIRRAEPDRIPFDLGGMAQSGIHRLAYAALRRHLGLPETEIKVLNLNTQQARLDADFQARLGVDAHLVYSRWADPGQAAVREDGPFWVYTDEWGVSRRMPRDGGLYYDVYRHPLAVDDIEQAWRDYRWPDPTHPERFAGLAREARSARDSGRFVVLMGLCPGVVEMVAWMRGYERFYADLATQPEVAARFFDRMVELKTAYWQRALAETAGCVDAVNEADDMAGQTAMLISPGMYRQLIKPHHRQLFAAIKQAAPGVQLIFHSCGAVRPIIPDLIEIGVDILNPVQITAAGMDPFELKREFGRDVVFWGGGIDAQQTLNSGSPQQVREEVKRNVEALAPGGGFVFAPTHIIQPNAPPENIMAMWQAATGH